MITFFSISPKKALLYGYKDAVNKYVHTYGWDLKDRRLVDRFNREIIASSQRFVFASDSNVLTNNKYHTCLHTIPTYAL